MDNAGINQEGSTWKSLFHIGGVAPLITLAIYLGQWIVILITGETYPITAKEWFVFFGRSKVLGLIYLNAFDVFSIAILGLMFLALYVALKWIHPSFLAIAGFFAFLGIAVFVASRADAVSAVLTLSDQYANSISEVGRSQILAAGEAVLAPTRATPETIGFLFIASGSLTISFVILKNKTFSEGIAYIGILAFLLTLANDISLVFKPSIASVLMPLNGFLWLIWWILMGRKLLQLGSEKAKASYE
jgi:hypothetical protein